MKLRGLLIAVVVLAALGGAAWWSERQKKAEEGKPAKDAPPKLVSIPDDQVQRVEIHRRTGENLVLARNASNAWEITTPGPYPADPDATSSLISALVQLSADRVVEDKAGDLSGYGLNPAAAEITITKKDGKSEKLLLGDETPLNNGAYAKLANDARVVTISSYTKQSLDKPASDLRDKHLVSFNGDKLTGVEVTVGGKGFAFAKNGAGEWAIVKPQPWRADNLAVDELVRKVKELQMLPQQEEEKSAKEFAGGTPVFTFKATDAGGPQTLEVRVKNGMNYAKSSVRNAVYTVDSSAMEPLEKGLDSYRNRKLFEFGFNDPNKVQVRDGNVSFSFTKGGEKWFVNGKEMDSTGVQATISRIRDLSARGFTESGFKSADVEVDITWNDGKKTDKVVFTRGDKDFVARREGEPGLYQVGASAVTEIVKAAADVKEAQPPAKDAKKK